MPPGRRLLGSRGNCLRDGLIAGAAAGLLGGMPSTLTLSAQDLDRSIQSIAHIVPGNRRFRSAGSRRALGGLTHMAISTTFALLYSCEIRKRLSNPHLPAAAGYGGALWAVNYKVAGPEAMKAEDRSFALADHLCWGAVVELCLQILDARRGESRLRLG